MPNTIAHVRRHPFIYLSAMLHAAPLAVLYCLGSYRIDVAAHQQRQRAIESGERLTQQARLEKRVHDMNRIKTLLEQSAAADRPRQARAGADQQRDKDDVQFSIQPRAPDALLEEAEKLSRSIDDIERDNKAERLAQLLDMPKEKALQQVAQAPEPEQPADAKPRNAEEAAAKIEQLEAKARRVLEQRRQELERRQNGSTVTAGAAPAEAGMGRGPGAGHGFGKGSGEGHPSGRAGQDGQSGRGGDGRGTAGGASDPSILARISEFTNPDLPDRMTNEYLGGGLGGFFDRGIGRVPDVDASVMVRGTGRMIGAGGTYANRVYVNRWYLIGPFPGKHGGGLFSNWTHPPEQGVVLDAEYRGKGGRLLRWEYVDMARYPLIPPDAAEDAVYYGYTELMSAEEQDLTIWVGADDDAQLWLNDRLVWRDGNVDKQWFFSHVYDTRNTYVRDYNLSEGKRLVHVRKGRNKLFFKLSNGPTRIYFSLVLTR